MWCRLENKSNLICVENIDEMDDKSNWLEFDDIEIASGYFNIPLYRYENLEYIDGKKVN
jgi:hypothetical protein